MDTKNIKRIPYVKVVSDITGEITNPITKTNPYLHPRVGKINKSSRNNKKGIRLVIMNYGRGLFVKYKYVAQLEKDENGFNKTIHQYLDTNPKSKF
jgi:hypothetical protein